MQTAPATLWIFDCDGVLLDSNRMKQKAFAAILESYPEEAVAPFLAFQRSAFGLSRFRTLDVFFADFLKRQPSPGEKEDLLEAFGAHCTAAYPRQSITPGTEALLERLRVLDRPAYVASGSAELELRAALTKIGLAQHFRGIYGSPRAKSDLIADILAAEPAHSPEQAIFLGDAEADFYAARDNGVTFLQVEDFCADPEGMVNLRELEGFPAVPDLSYVRPE